MLITDIICQTPYDLRGGVRSSLRVLASSPLPSGCVVESSVQKGGERRGGPKGKILFFGLQEKSVRRGCWTGKRGLRVKGSNMKMMK